MAARRAPEYRPAWVVLRECGGDTWFPVGGIHATKTDAERERRDLAGSRNLLRWYRAVRYIPAPTRKPKR